MAGLPAQGSAKTGLPVQSLDSDLDRAGHDPEPLARTLTEIGPGVPRAHARPVRALARPNHSVPDQPSVARIFALYGGASAVDSDHTSLLPALAQ